MRHYRGLGAGLLGAGLLVAGLLLAAGCSSGGSDSEATPEEPINGLLAVRAVEWGYQPPVVLLKQGEQVRLILQNQGRVLHNITVEGIDADISSSNSTGPLKGDEGEFFVGADAGQRGEITFVPQGAGTYAFYCTVEGHRALGMEGTLIVQ